MNFFGFRLKRRTGHLDGACAPGEDFPARQIQRFLPWTVRREPVQALFGQSIHDPPDPAPDNGMISASYGHFTTTGR
jgi:hypothetical protein